MALHIITAGPLATVQDKGRFGYADRGFSESGVCDKYSMKLANLLVGNFETAEQAAVLELTLRGGEIRFSSEEILALTGADMKPVLNGRPVPMFAPVLVNAGDVLNLGMATEGLRTYLAVYGGIGVPGILGSRSTNLKCQLGGLDGRSLKDGDILETGGDAVKKHRLWETLSGREHLLAIGEAEPWFRLSSTPYRMCGEKRCVLLRVVPGPQEETFTQAGKDTFVRNFYRLTSDSNRMACKLEGPEIETQGGSDIISDGIVEGSIQVASNGMPIIMMADHQTTGGYAKIGTVISTDIPALAQRKPGEEVAFRFVSPREGVEICRKEAQKLMYLERRIKERMQERMEEERG